MCGYGERALLVEDSGLPDFCFWKEAELIPTRRGSSSAVLFLSHGCCNNDCSILTWNQESWLYGAQTVICSMQNWEWKNFLCETFEQLRFISGIFQKFYNAVYPPLQSPVCLMASRKDATFWTALLLINLFFLSFLAKISDQSFKNARRHINESTKI